MNLTILKRTHNLCIQALSNLVLLLVALWPVSLAQATDELSLKEAREFGRLKSRILKSKTADSKVELPEPMAALPTFRKSIAPILNKSCLPCHGPAISEGGLRVDQLDPDLLNGPHLAHWREIYQVVGNSEMPPEDESDTKLSNGDREQIVDWVSTELNKASRQHRNQKSRSSFRRLTNYEHQYALQDLLGINYSLVDRLPPETASEDGFKNQADLLQLSASQFETFREIGLNALKRATVGRERPESVTYILSMEQEFKALTATNKSQVLKTKAKRKKRNQKYLYNRKTDDGIHYSPRPLKPTKDATAGQSPAPSQVVLELPPGNDLKLNLDRFLPDEGTMRISVRASRSNKNPKEFANLRLVFSAHTSNDARFSEVISQRDIPVIADPDQPEFIRFDIQLSEIQRNPFRKLDTPFPRRDEFLTIQNISNASNQDESLKVLIDHIEISAPFFGQWPPESHTNIFFPNDDINRKTGVESHEQKYGRAVLSRFMERAWRRAVTTQEVDQFLTLFKKYRPEFDTLEEAMLEVLATVLASPDFLYLTRRNDTSERSSSQPINDWELASRLSFFLWSSIPDQELLRLAKAGKLKQPETLSRQIQRMLADSRATRFADNFTQQWLGLDGLSSVPHVKDSSLRAAMEQEPVAFFKEVLSNNRSVMDFIHSDYLVINQRLANHYRVANVHGPHFRKVPIQQRANRGGLLTNAAVLAINSDGKDSNPLKRGVWMLERILHDPPPPPPPNVPEVDLTDPKILQMTLKERIADHRNKPACYSCHSRIDPWGIAFENYDALGVYRTRVGNKPVDATSRLFNQQELSGILGLKRYLLQDRQDQFARAMVSKLAAYALGRSLTFSDHTELEEITRRFRERGDRLGDLVDIMVSSKLFQTH